MNILFIITDIPYPVHKDGVALINYRLLSQAPNDVSIDLIYTNKKDSNAEIELKRVANRIKNIYCIRKTESSFIKLVNLFFVFLFGRVIIKNRYLKRKMVELINNYKYHLIYTSPLTMITEMDRTKNIPPVFLNAVDSYSLLCSSFYKKNNTFKNKFKTILYLSYEKKLLVQVDCINFVSYIDANHVENISKHKNIKNITLGIDEKVFFLKNNILKEPCSLLFTGNFAYQPNMQTAKYIMKEIYPSVYKKYPNAKLYIVGKNSSSLESKNSNIIITGFVENICDWYNKVEIFVCPLLYGAGIKNKVLEAMACGLPVIASSVAVSGIRDIENNKHFILAESKEDFIDAIEKLFKNKGLRESLKYSAINFIKENYNWDMQIKLYYNQFAVI